ncbi:MAG: phosphoribosyltransferase family protein [Treponemataceae bacterium]
MKQLSRIFFVLFFYSVHFLRVFFLILCARNECIHCGKISYFNLCSDCKKKTLGEMRLKRKRCSLCGKFLISEKEFCVQCRVNPTLKALDKNFALYSYHLWAKEFLFLWKIAENRLFSFELAKRFFIFYQSLNDKNFVLVPIPPRPHKIAKKGWDQINDIILIVKFLWGIPVLSLLKRQKSVEQKKLSKNDRLENSKNNFTLAPLAKRTKSLPAKVLLIDDILTTGATLENCARVLKDAGIKEVQSFTFFIVV